LPFEDAPNNKVKKRSPLITYAGTEAEEKAAAPGARRFQQLMLGLDRRGLPKRSEEMIEYPEMLRNAKRDVYEALLRRNEMVKRDSGATTSATDIMTIPTMTMSFSFDVPATCTPIASSSSTSTAVSGQGQSGAAALTTWACSLLGGVVLVVLAMLL
jgi:hypothetical protein